jgi:hypothetical protein
MAKNRIGQVAAGAAVRQALRSRSSLRGNRQQPGPPVQDLDERIQRYGEAPEPLPHVRLTKEQRAELVPRILELRNTGLSWSLVAREMGLRAGQVERAFKEWKERSTCECGAPGVYQEDPYTKEIHGESVFMILCDDCRDAGTGGKR